MHGMIVYFEVIAVVFVPLCISAWIRRWIAGLRSVPKPPSRLRKRLLPSKAWCSPERTAGTDWKN